MSTGARPGGLIIAPVVAGAVPVAGCGALATAIDVQVTGAGAGAGATMTGRTPVRAGQPPAPVGVPAGKAGFVVSHTGGLVRELVVRPLPAGGPDTRTPGADGTIDGSWGPGEASRPRGAGAGGGISPGSTARTTVTFDPDRLEPVCDQTYHHHDDAMVDVLMVT